MVNWGLDGIEYEADPKHRNILLEKFGFKEGETRNFVCNGDKERQVESGWQAEEVGGLEAAEFRANAARLNFLSLDCPDLQFVSKDASRDMATPKNGSWGGLEKIVRYLVGRKRVIWFYEWQDEVSEVEVFGDSDWGGRVGSRKSTSGGVSWWVNIVLKLGVRPKGHWR